MIQRKVFINRIMMLQRKRRNIIGRRSTRMLIFPLSLSVSHDLRYSL